MACPFCGKRLEESDNDTVYPTGTAWADDVDSFRCYVSYKDAPKKQWCYGVTCQVSAGGCGANITGDSKKEAISKWNKRS